MSFQRHRLLASLVVIGIAGAACGPAPAAVGSIYAVDDVGDTVRLAEPAGRVVSLIPATTELLFAIGAGDAVAGRTPWDDWPPAAAEVPVVGDGISPNVEAIIARRPDLVVLYPSASNAAAVQRLRDFGVAVFQARTDRIASVPRHARALGRLTGHEARADSLVNSFLAELASATVSADSTAPRLFLLVWQQPPMTVGRGSFLSELIARAGGRNIFADLASSSAPISIEAVAARDPDLILTLSDTAPDFARRPEWQSVQAVRERRFVSIAGSEFSRPSPRAPAAIRTLRARLEAAGW